MKKNRNTFFSENNNNFQGVNPFNNMPYQYGANSSFYASGGSMMAGGDLEQRFAKIDRQINRLEHRISTIENSLVKSTDDFDSSSNTNMYMI